MNNNKIYVVATLEKLEKSEHGWPECGDERTVGFFHEFNEAEDIVKCNGCDLHEGLYNYAIIEEVYPGLYPNSRMRWLYKYNQENDCYEKIAEPDYMKSFVSITMG